MPASKKTKSTSKKTAASKKTKSTSKKTAASKKTETKASKKPISKKTKTTTKRTVAKPSSSKAKSVIVDVIEDDFDEVEKKSLSDFLDPSAEVFENSAVKIETVEDLEIDVEVEGGDKNEDFSGVIGEDLDSQKKFFEELRDETKENIKAGKGGDLKNQGVQDKDVQDLLDLFEDDDSDNKKIKKTHNSRSLKLYSRFVWKFLLIVFLLVVFVGYFSFSKLTIDIVPKNEALNESLLLKVSGNSGGIRLLSDPRENVSGLSKEIPVSLSRDFSASGEEFVGEDISGRVKIINNYSRSQALVATTRLWSPDGKEFRIKEGVTIPANDEIWADIYVEKPSRDLAISSTTFTIPGLWVGLQDSIYAKSEENFIFEQKKEKYIRASDLAAAEQEVDGDLLKELLTKIETEKKNLELESGQSFVYIYFQEGETLIDTDAEVDDREETFNVKAEANFRVIFFSKEESEKLAYGKLNLLIPSGKELMDFNPDNISYSLESFNAEDNIATIKSTFSAKMMLKSDGEVVEKENLVNLNAEQLNSYLNDQPEIKSFSLKFQPSFIKTVPRLVDRIKINLVEDND